jgi:nucleotidyltransferase substrate binding protein (TIGR01987 family)
MKQDVDLTILSKAKDKLDDFMLHSGSDQEKAGIIQAFEYCYELSWKTIKRHLNNEGIEVNSPRSAFREAGKVGLISDVKLWFDFLEKRNLTTHTYNEKVLKIVLYIVPVFQKELALLLSTLKKIT